MRVDYGYYKDNYKGILIPNSDFERLELRANEKLDYYTLDRIPSELEEDDVKIKNCICAIAENIYNLSDKNNIASESVGTHSVTYKNDASMNKTIYSTIKEYLSETGLLFRGC